MKNPERREQRVLSALGLARRAGQLIIGTDMVCDAMRRGGVRLVAEASDTSENTHKKLTDKCASHKTPHIRLEADGSELARAVGKSGKISAVGVTGEISRVVSAAFQAIHGAADAPQPDNKEGS